MHVLPRVADAELMQSKLNLDFIKFTNDSSRREISSCARFFDFCFTFSTCSGHFKILSDFVFHKDLHKLHKYDRFSILFH